MTAAHDEPFTSGGTHAESPDVFRFDAGAALHDGYRKALEHLYGRLDTEALDPASFNTVERDLDLYRAFLNRLGDPHLAVPTVHVTGTRGKGTFTATLESILRSAGLKTGATISPHLSEVRERIRIDGDDLPREEFSRLYEKMLPSIEEAYRSEAYRTVFELITALAFLAFRESAVDAAVVEVGLGGRLDATNVVQPELAVVTRIGLDHTKVLGDSVEKIAWDKAHILKQGSEAVLGPQPPGALGFLEERCRSMGITPWRHGREYDVAVREISEAGTRFDVRTPHREHLDLMTPLLGEHMAENAAIAVAAADRLDATGRMSISPEAVQAGVSDTRWPGRGEILRRDPLLVVDGAHSPLGAEALGKLVRQLWPDRPLTLLLGINRDKDLSGFLEALALQPALAVATAADTPRAYAPNELADALSKLGFEAAGSPMPEAVRRAVELTPSGGLILATGSLYLAGAVRRAVLTPSGE